MKSQIFILALLLTSCPIIRAQSDLIIQAFDQDSQLPLGGVSISLSELSGIPKITTSQGIVFFQGIPKDRKITIDARKTGYVAIAQLFVPLPPGIESYKIYLKKDPNNMAIHISGKIDNQNSFPVNGARVFLSVGKITLIDTTDKFGKYEFLINRNDLNFPDFNISIECDSCQTREINYPIMKKDLDNFDLYRSTIIAPIKVECQENIDVIYEKFALEWSNNPNSKQELRRGASFFFDNFSNFRKIVREIITKSEASLLTNADVICSRILIENIDQMISTRIYEPYVWNGNVYHKGLGRWNFLPKSTYSLSKENAKQLSYEKFCNVAEYLISTGNKLEADSSYLKKLLKIEGPLSNYLIPTLAFIGHKREKNGKSSLMMFRYPAYNLSDNDLREYDMENRIWWKAATQRRNTMLFDEDIEGYKTGLTFPYPDIRGFMSRTFWCSKTINNETIIFGFDFSLFPR